MISALGFWRRLNFRHLYWSGRMENIQHLLTGVSILSLLNLFLTATCVWVT